MTRGGRKVGSASSNESTAKSRLIGRPSSDTPLIKRESALDQMNTMVVETRWGDREFQLLRGDITKLNFLST